MIKKEMKITRIPLTNWTVKAWTRAYPERCVEFMCPINDWVTTTVPNEVTLAITFGAATLHIFLDSSTTFRFKSPSSSALQLSRGASMPSSKSNIYFFMQHHNLSFKQIGFCFSISKSLLHFYKLLFYFSEDLIFQFFCLFSLYLYNKQIWEKRYVL